MTIHDIDTLARTIYGEARSENDAARIGVACVVLNRVKAGTFPGAKTISAVCLAHRQFDCWDADTADCKATLAVTIDDPTFMVCWGIAMAATAGDLKDDTDGAVFYHDVSRAGPPSVWGRVRLTAKHGRLNFYAQDKA